jgi:hypothetical protein
MEYRGRPTLVEAFQWDGTEVVPEWLRKAVQERDATMGTYYILIAAKIGCIRCNPGDWLIRLESGQIHVMITEDFEHTYGQK